MDSRQQSAGMTARPALSVVLSSSKDRRVASLYQDKEDRKKANTTVAAAHIDSVLEISTLNICEGLTRPKQSLLSLPQIHDLREVKWETE